MSIGDWIEQAVAIGGYPGIALAILVENVFPPIPSEVILPFAGFYVSRGELLFPLAVLAATAGSVTGALLLYALGRRGGRPLVLRYRRVLRVSESDLERADRWFDRHADALVLIGRMIPGLRSIVSVPAGIAEMPLGRFVLLTMIGSGIWNAALIGAGWGLGAEYERVAAAIGSVATVVVATLAVAAIAAVAALLWRRR